MKKGKDPGLPLNQLRIHERWLVWNFCLNTDHGHFEELLAQAKALERAGERHYARKEYIRAFNIFRRARYPAILLHSSLL